jgi:hypothetical protein
MTLELAYFINEGFGWECKRCRRQPAAPDAGELPRFFREGEAEEKEMRLTTPALARWRDAARQILYCPNCLDEERVSQE